uniref:TPR repeat-containing protein n=1 Tax=Candidatus Kentrum sp. LFY TaxID=2126342 RepID=A0A450VC75_9GAMM|nr:MAG: TPR repeat-containing protein [Candidatus Kentron sp. LFY]
MQTVSDWTTIIDSHSVLIMTIATVIIAIFTALGFFVQRSRKNVASSEEEIEAVVQKILTKHQKLPQAEGLADGPPGIEDLAAKDQEIAELTRAIEALRDPDAPDRERRAEAEAALVHGDTQLADALFAELEHSAAGKAAAAAREDLAQRRQAAAAARHRGAIAFLHDTHGALVHYRRAVEYDPEDAIGWNRIGHLKHRLGELAEAEAAYERVRAIGHATGDRAVVAAALGNLGVVAKTRGELVDAEKYHRQALAIDEELGRKEGMASDLGNLGGLAEARGELDEAEEYYRRALALFEAVGARPQVEKTRGLLQALRERRGR